MALTILKNNWKLSDKAQLVYDTVSSGDYGGVSTNSLDPILQCVATVLGPDFLSKGSAYFSRSRVYWPGNLLKAGLKPKNYLSVSYDSIWGIFGDTYWIDCDLEQLYSDCLKTHVEDIDDIFPSDELEYVDDIGNSVEMYGNRVECDCDSPAMCRCEWVDLYVKGGSLLQRRYQVIFESPEKPQCCCDDNVIHDTIRKLCVATS